MRKILPATDCVCSGCRYCDPCCCCSTPHEHKSDLPIGATREGIDAAKATAYVSSDKHLVMFAPNTGPANGLGAARELIGIHASFSHLKNGYPVYTD